MRSELRIGSRMVGKGHPVFAMAEVGGEIMADRTIVYEYETTSGRRSEKMYEMLGDADESLAWDDV